MKQKFLYIMLCLTLGMAFLIGNYSKCSLGGTNEEINIWEKELKGEISSQEAADMINSLPMENRSPDVQAAASSSNKTSTTNTQPETPKTESNCSHTYTSEVLREPTCVKEGLRKYICQSCGNTYTEEIELVDEHDYKEEITKEATCDETGEKTFTCKDCGETYTELINALGHNDEMERTKNPTCTEQGEMTYTCSRCGLSHVENIEAKGHTESEWNTVTPQGMFSEGLKEKHCVDCGAVLSEVIIPSIYPVYYLHIGIGAVLAIAATVTIFVVGIVKNKRK